MMQQRNLPSATCTLPAGSRAKHAHHNSPGSEGGVCEFRPSVLLAHSFYQQEGGENGVVRAEQQLLEAAGHEVSTWFRFNREIDGYRRWDKILLGARSVWAWDTRREFESILRRRQPDLVHFHNILPLLSPSAYYCCKQAGIPVVQTVHNYRFMCPSALLYRKAKVCEACVGKAIPWPAVVHGCYRNSRLASAAVGTMLVAHRLLSVWHQAVDCYLALSDFARRKLVEAGVPAEKIVVKPNFMSPDPGMREGAGEFAMFAGRFSAEKGIATLVDAWRKLKPALPLVLAGDGELAPSLKQRAVAGTHFVGWLPKHEMLAHLKRARFLIIPSETYENFPLSLVEAFACGVPVVASRLGALAELIEHGRTGLHFEAGNSGDLAATVAWAWSHPREMEEIGRQGRREYEAKYTAAQNYVLLNQIYARVLQRRPYLRPGGG
jgi:glycosyltransferase involved in cell wall biosynthesis